MNYAFKSGKNDEDEAIKNTSNSTEDGILSNFILIIIDKSRDRSKSNNTRMKINELQGIKNIVKKNKQVKFQSNIDITFIESYKEFNLDTTDIAYTDKNEDYKNLCKCMII